MKIKIQKTTLLEGLSLATRFTSSRVTSVSALQGVLLVGEKEKLQIYSTNLSSYYHGSFITEGEKFKILVEPKKIIEFLNLLYKEDIEIEIKGNILHITQDKTKGSFPVINNTDFPMPPPVLEKEQEIETSFLLENLPYVLFSAAKDETRPVLSAVNILTANEQSCIVSTDGFRLSLIKTNKKINLPNILISSDFLNNVLENLKEVKKTTIVYSEKEKVVLIKAGHNEFYTRAIEGEFPPFEKVIPTEKRTTVILDREETIRNLKIVSVFAREHANIIICEFRKNELLMRPKAEENKEDSTSEDIELQGDEQKVAFNSRFLLEYLMHAQSKKIIVEIVRAEAPIVFKEDKKDNALHIIMPIRIQE